MYLPVIHLDRKGSGGGGSGTGWQGQVEFRADLPITVGSPAVGDVYLVEKPTTTLLGLYTTYQSGLYIRDLNNGNLNDWRRLNVKVKFTDGEFAVVSSADNSKQAKFDMSLLTASTTRTYQWQDQNGTVALLSDVPTGDALYLVKTRPTDAVPNYLESKIPSSQDIQNLSTPPGPGGNEQLTRILWPKNKPWLQTVDPTVSDDSSVVNRHQIGQLWVNTTSQEVFAAKNLNTGAAIWRSLELDQHSGYNIIQTSKNVTIETDKEMIVSSLTVNGSLTIDGILTLLN